MKIRDNSIALPGIILFLVIMVLGVIYVHYTWKRFENDRADKVMEIARSIEATLPKSDLKMLEAKPGDLVKPQYTLIKKILKAIIRIDPNVRFAYLYNEQKGKIYFYADSEAENSPDYSPPGQEYTEAMPEYLVPLTNGKTLIAGPVSDRWGVWVSVLVPIKDDTNGKPYAVFGMDYNAKSWNSFLWLEVFQSCVLVFLLLLAFFFLLIIQAKNKSLKNDIIERKLAGEALLQSQGRTRLQRNAIARIALDEVIAFGTLTQSLNRLTEEVASAIRVSRASVWLYTEDKAALQCSSLFEAEANRHSSGILLKSDDYPRYFEAIKRESRINADEAQTDLRTSEFAEGYLKPLGISSMLDAGITLEGKLNGVVCFEHTGEKRIWHPDEESFASTVASIVAQILSNNVRKLAEDALRVSEEKYRNIFENVQDVFYQTDLSGIVQEISPSIKYFSQFNRDEILGFSVDKLYKSPGDRDTLINEILKNGELRDYELILRTKSGVTRNASINARLIYDAQGNPHHIDGAIRDITERKQAEAELIKAKERAEESDRLKSAFLANMSHEIRTPMNGILGFASLLKEPGLTGEDQQEYIRIIEKSGARMLNIINDIVDISKIESGLMEVDIKDSDINHQMEYIYNFFRPEFDRKKIQFSLKNGLPSNEATIKTDREKIYAILTNLVKNANKYTNHGSIEFGYNKKGSFLEFYVRDTGIGIPHDRQEAIFERFIQADIFDKHALQGAGLGLSITKAYVEMLGGNIWVESKEGVGSTFFFTLPYNAGLQKQSIAPAHVHIEESTVKIENLKVLIAEDDETSVMFLTKSMKGLVKEIFLVKTGMEAVEFCSNHPDTDLVLMDIGMPEMNGYEATMRIRQFNKEVVIIAQTAFGLLGDREKALDAGCDDYISKPIEGDSLMKLIHKYFNNQTELS